MAVHEGDDVLLYYEANSYLCHRVLVSLQEKELKYKKVEVDVQNLHNLSPDYIRLNPSAETPTLVHGVEVVAGADKILHYLDEAFPRQSQLFPEEDTKEGWKCQYLLKLAAKIDLVKLTLGVPFNVELAQVDSESIETGYTEQDVGNIITSFRENLPEKCDQLAQENEDLKEEYEHLKERGLNFPEQIDEDELDAALKMTNDVIAKLEDELLTRKIEEPPDKEWWLIGKTFSVADIYWGSILCRLEQIGLAKRYWADEKRLHVTAYLNRIKQRDSFLEVPKTKFEKFVEKVKRKWPWMIPVGATVAGVLVFIII